MKEILEYMAGLLTAERLTVKIGAIPAYGELAIQQTTESVQNFRPKTGVLRETYVINTKDRRQDKALERLEKAHTVLTKRKGYGSTNRYQVASIRTLNGVQYLGQENNESHMFGSSIEVLSYDRLKAGDDT